MIFIQLFKFFHSFQSLCVYTKACVCLRFIVLFNSRMYCGEKRSLLCCCSGSRMPLLLWLCCCCCYYYRYTYLKAFIYFDYNTSLTFSFCFPFIFHFPIVYLFLIPFVGTIQTIQPFRHSI